MFSILEESVSQNSRQQANSSLAWTGAQYKVTRVSVKEKEDIM
jgi:hypothetical protein